MKTMKKMMMTGLILAAFSTTVYGAEHTLITVDGKDIYIGEGNVITRVEGEENSPLVGQNYDEGLNTILQGREGEVLITSTELNDNDKFEKKFEKYLKKVQKENKELATLYLETDDEIVVEAESNGNSVLKEQLLQMLDDEDRSKYEAMTVEELMAVEEIREEVEEEAEDEGFFTKVKNFFGSNQNNVSDDDDDDADDMDDEDELDDEDDDSDDDDDKDEVESNDTDDDDEEEDEEDDSDDDDDEDEEEDN